MLQINNYCHTQGKKALREMQTLRTCAGCRLWN